MAEKEELPICPKCGGVLKLEDMRQRRAAATQRFGLVYPPDPYPYRMVCCELVLRVEDEGTRWQLVRMLKEYHGIKE
jgi:hypothetical protein